MIIEQFMNPAVHELISEIAEVAGYLWQRGWAERNAGNITVNLTQLVHKPEWGIHSSDNIIPLNKPVPLLSDKVFFVTGTGKRMRDLAKNPLGNCLFLQVSGDGKLCYLINSSSGRSVLPTSELPTHLAIHEMIAARDSNEKVVLHTHATELITLTQHPSVKDAEVLNSIIWGMHPESMVFIPKGVGFVPYFLPGSQVIAEETISLLHTFDMVLWEKHGVFAIGKEIQDVFDNIDIASKSAGVYLSCKNAGFQPEGLTKAQLADLRELVKKFGL